MIGRVENLVEQQLWPRSAEVDRGTTLPIEHFEAISALGLYAMAVPQSAGGLGLAPSEIRHILRLLASGCGVTAFAFAQHHGTIGAVVNTKNEPLRSRWLPRLVDDHLAGIAYAHVRRRGAPVLTAEPAGDGWLLNGSAPWVTSWGVAKVIGVAANTDDGRLLWALVPAAEAQGLSVAGNFDLMAYSATQTVALDFDRFEVGPEAVLSVGDMEDWSARDRLLAARPNPLCVGVGDRALAELQRIAPDVAAELAPWWAEVAAEAEAHSAAVDAAVAAIARGGAIQGEATQSEAIQGEAIQSEAIQSEETQGGRESVEVAEVAAARADTVLATQKLTTALLAATGGAAMEMGHSAQRLSREALFYVIQAQSGDGRAAMLSRLRPDH